MNIPKNLKYTKSHEWVEFLTDNTAKVGLTDFAQHALGDLVYVNLPEEGDEVTKSTAFADVESVKAVSDVYSPLTGKVTAINEDLLDTPGNINANPYDSWLIEVGNINDKNELMDAETYEKHCAEEA